MGILTARQNKTNVRFLVFALFLLLITFFPPRLVVLRGVTEGKACDASAVLQNLLSELCQKGSVLAQQRMAQVGKHKEQLRQATARFAHSFISKRRGYSAFHVTGMGVKECSVKLNSKTTVH